MGKQSNRRKSNRFQWTATSITNNGMSVSRKAGITLEQATLAAALMMALTANDVNAAMSLSIEIERQGASIFEFEVETKGPDGFSKRGLVQLAFEFSQEAVILWISQKAIDDDAWPDSGFLRRLPDQLEILAVNSLEHRITSKVIRLLADRVTKELVTDVCCKGIGSFDDVEMIWSVLPKRTLAIFHEGVAFHLSQMEKADLVAATATPAAPVNGARSTSNRL